MERFAPDLMDLTRLEPKTTLAKPLADGYSKALSITIPDLETELDRWAAS
jgi:hypothetical protein